MVMGSLSDARTLLNTFLEPALPSLSSPSIRAVKTTVRAGTLKMQVVPGRSVGKFVLGLSLHETFTLLQNMSVKRQAQDLPMLKADFVYHEQDPFSGDLVIVLHEQGLVLKFDARTQLLRLIEVSNFNAVQLFLKGVEFGSARVLPTFENVYKTFGPCHPGDLDEKTNMYALHYAGLSFIFPIPEKFKQLYTAHAGRAALPLEFPDGKTPTCTKLFLYPGESLWAALGVQGPAHSINDTHDINQIVLPVPADETYLEPVVARLGSGLFFQHTKRILLFDLTAQEVIADFGAPQSIYFKNDASFLIHADGESRRSSGAGLQKPSKQDSSGPFRDYFFNYFDLGIDVLFDGERHTVKRIVLHTNCPGHVDFNTYRKCNFSVDASESSSRLLTSTWSAQPPTTAASTHTFTCDMKWDEIRTLLGQPHGEPIWNKVVTPSQIVSPFGPTLCYGYDNLVLEVMENNNLNSITLFHA